MVWFQFRPKGTPAAVNAAVAIGQGNKEVHSKFGGLTCWPCCAKPFSGDELKQIKAEVAGQPEDYYVIHEHDCRSPHPKVFFCRDGDEIFYKRYEL